MLVADRLIQYTTARSSKMKPNRRGALSIFEAKAAVAIKHPPPPTAASSRMLGEAFEGGLEESLSGFAWTAEKW